MTNTEIRSEIRRRMWALRKRVESYDLLLAEDELRDIESLIRDNNIEDEYILETFDNLKKNLVIADDALWNPWHGDVIWRPWHGAP